MIRAVRAEERHLEPVLAIERACFPDPWSGGSFRSELDCGDSCFIVAEDEGAVLGFGILRSFADEAEILNIAVTPSCQGRGVGRLLVETLLGCAEARGSRTVYLEVRESNIPAHQLYKKCGFSFYGRRKNYYADPQEDALLMRRSMDIQGD